MNAETNSSRGHPVHEVLPFAAGLLSVAINIGIQDIYLRMYSGSPKLIAIALVAVFGIPLLMSVQRLGSSGVRTARFLTAASAVYALLEVAGIGSVTSANAVLMMLITGCIASWVKDLIWLRARRVLIAMPLLFAVTPVLLGPATAPATEWPPRQGSKESEHQRPPVVFLLLDEMGASAAQPLLTALDTQGWPFTFKAVESVGDMTLKVIPQMFTGKAFPNARPCAPTTVCDRFHALNFSTVTASRPDIDIVGFYHPYCAIQSLRWCMRTAPEPDLLYWDRWRCAALRLLGQSPQSPECREIPLRRWADLVDKVLAGVDQAPFWQKGGMLYIHVPLPHPPGISTSGSLREHYAHNIEKATGFVTHLSERLRENFGTQARLVIFSDHGLRYQYACSTPLYASMPCDIPDNYKSLEVPLIVAGPASNEASRVHTNAEVFLLAN